jgi:DNA-binding CsgD family transcriptional regulator
LPATLIAHIDALVAGDVQGLARAGNDMIGLGYVGLGAEALDQAADLSARDGRLQAARGWASRAAAVRRHDDVSATPWLVGPATVPLTHREREVAGLASSGYSDAQIARRLDLSVRTVETHLARVYHKWGLSGRHELASRLQLS